MKRFFHAALGVAACGLVSVTQAQIMIPNNYYFSAELVGGHVSGIGEDSTEITAFDSSSDRMFITHSASNQLEAVDLSDPGNPQSLGFADLSPYGGGPNSVATYQGLVAVAVEDVNKQAPGQVLFFDAADFGTGSKIQVGPQPIHQVMVGALPDMLAFNEDGTRLLVANEGEGAYPSDKGGVSNPEGSVSIINLSSGVASATVATVGFTDFNAGGPRNAELPADIRLYAPPANTVSTTVAEDLEPEYIAIQGNVAYVSLQENNAVAVIDIPTARVEAIHALGFKDHNLAGYGLDASDRDSGINIQNWPVMGMYMPDAIAAYQVGGSTYYVTANEGDARAGDERIKDLTLDPTAFPDAATLQADEALGRLDVANDLGDTDNDGDYDVLYAYGARSFTIWSSQGTRVFDSGDDFEQITASLVPAFFNSKEGDADEFDSRSDAKGPEPESVVIGDLGGRQYAYVGLERTGGIMVYDVTDPANAEFVQYITLPPLMGSIQLMKSAEGIEFAAPEGLIYVPANESPNEEPLLIASHEFTGTVAMISIDACVTSDITVNADSIRITGYCPDGLDVYQDGVQDPIFENVEVLDVVTLPFTSEPGDSFYAALPNGLGDPLNNVRGSNTLYAVPALSLPAMVLLILMLSGLAFRKRLFQ